LDAIMLPYTPAIRPMNTPDPVILRPARVHEASAMAAMSRELIETGLGWRSTPLCMAALITDA
jgi:hypothetical protein